jgi:hypothetical protein
MHWGMAAQVQKGRFVVLAACGAEESLAFVLGGEALWLGKVEARSQRTFQLHYYRQQAPPRSMPAGARREPAPAGSAESQLQLCSILPCSGMPVPSTKCISGSTAARCFGCYSHTVMPRAWHLQRVLEKVSGATNAGRAAFFEPCVDDRGYPVIGEQALDARTVVASFGELECAARGGAGALPEAVIEVLCFTVATCMVAVRRVCWTHAQGLCNAWMELKCVSSCGMQEVSKRLAGLRLDAGSSADEHSPIVSLAGWASPL